MLTLAQSVHLGSWTVFRDFVVSGRASEFTRTFYVLPDAPCLAATPEGDPWFDFVWYRTADPAATAKRGGLATIVAELALKPDERSALVPQVSRVFSIPETDVSLKSIDFKSGTVALTYAGEAPAGGDLVNQVSGSGPAQLSGSERATFIVDLNGDGAALLWQALEKRLKVFHLRYDLVFDHRLCGAQLRVWADGRRSLSIASDLALSGGLDPSRLRSALTDQRVAGVELVTDTPLPTAEMDALQKLGNDLLQRALESALFAPPASGEHEGQRPLRPYSESLEASLNFTLDEAYPLERHAVLDTILSPEFTADQRGRRLRQTQLGAFFSILDVQVVCTVDFSLGLLSAVKATLSYNAEAGGQRIQRAGEFVFNEGAAPVQRFRADMASPGKDSYRYSLDVYYRGDPSPWHMDFPETRGTVLTIDLDEAGILSARVELRDVPFDVVSSAVVNLRHSVKPLSQTVVLDGKTMYAVWRTVVRDAPKTWDYKVDWVLLDGRRLQGSWSPAASGTVYLDAPAELRSRSRIQVIAVGDFSLLAQVAIDLRSRPDGANQTQLTFTADGETHTWEAVIAPGDSLQYEYRRTFIYRDGTVRTPDATWVPSTRLVLAVSDDSQFEVKILPRLLDLGNTLKLVILDLESDAVAPERREKKTLLLKSKQEETRWVFRPEAPLQHKYRYRLSAITSDGGKTGPTEWQGADSSILVLQFHA